MTEPTATTLPPAILQRCGGDARQARIYLDAARRLLPEVRAHDAALGPTALHLDETSAERRAVLDLLDEALAENKRLTGHLGRIRAQRDAAWAREDELRRAFESAWAERNEARSEVARFTPVAESPNRCGQVRPSHGRDLGPCVRDAGHPEDVSHVDRFGALWRPRSTDNTAG